MYKNKTVCVVVPAYNEETQIRNVITTMPSFVDKIIIINDCSRDKTQAVVEGLKLEHPSLVLVNHTKNLGVGGAIATGYKWARDNHMDATVVMAGDGQMDPADLQAILDPVIDEGVDYTKGNRLFTGEAFQKIPYARYFGNAFLSFLTKIASGYWHVADSQTGYTCINNKALHLIDWDKMYKRYGQPNDLLVRLNVYDLRVRDIPVNPLYNIGERSGIKMRKIIFTIPWLLVNMFLWRMKEKYIIRNFHPLVFFYFLGFTFSILTFFLFLRIGLAWHYTGRIPPINALAAMFAFMSASFFTLFAMWFDMETNKDLK